MAEPDEEHDAQLVERARKDPAAFGLLYQRYVKQIYNYMYYRTGDPHEAEDLTARAFQRVLGHLSQYVDRGLPFSAWLYRIAHNLVANWHRDRSRRQFVPLDDVPLVAYPATGPEEAAEYADEQRRLLAAMRGLSPERQQVVILKFVERMSNAEIGAVMGRSESAVKALYHRTLLALRDALAAQDKEQP